jgi:hypothetical protein
VGARRARQAGAVAVKALTLATKAGISTTKTKITALYAAIDVSDQEPFAAMARLGLQIVQVPLP